MALTQLSDLVAMIHENYDTFNALSVQLSTELNALYQSGIVIPDPRLDEMAKGQGSTFNIPFFNDLGTNEPNIDTDAITDTATPLKIGSGKDVAIKHMRNQAWSVADLAAALNAVDPMKAVIQLIEGYWVRQYQRMLIASLNGILADNDANDSDDMIYSIATDAADAITDAECISGDAVVLAKQTMGDQSKKLAAIAMHSVPYSKLQRQNLIQSVRDPNTGKTMFESYLDMMVIVDDQCPAVSGANRITYTSFLFGQGSVGMGNGAPKIPLEYQRQALQGNGAGVETLVSRKHFILHPRGVKWADGSVAGNSPTNTELALAANWDRVYDRKNVRLAFLKTNG